MMKLEKKIRQIVEAYRSSDTYAPFIRHQLELIYRPLGMWGHAPNPNDDCQTNLGVINIFPHSEQDVWSVLNRFDTNKKVKDRLHKLFLDSNTQGHSQNDFHDWIEENREDLFGPDGSYTQELVDLNMETIISGNKNEEYSVKVLNQRFPNTKIKRFCSGDIRDTKKGIDISVEHPSSTLNIQVKPFNKVSSYVEPDGDTFFEVTSYLDVNKYSEKNVDIFMFVDSDKNEFILFKNKKTKIGQMRNNIVRFYEPPLYTNMVFQTKEKRKMRSFQPTDSLFGVETDTLKNLEFRKEQIQKMIDRIKNKISN